MDPDAAAWTELLGRWQAGALSVTEAPRLMRLALPRIEYRLALDVRQAFRDVAEPPIRALLDVLGAWAELRLGAFEAARAQVDALEVDPALARLPQVAALRARVRIYLAGYDGRPDESDRQLGLGLAAAEQAGDADLLIRLRALAASVAADLGDLAGAVPALDSEVAAAEVTGSAALLADVTYARGDVLYGAGRIDEALRDYEAVSVLQQRAGIASTIAQLAAGDCRLELGDLRRARADIEAGVANARRTGERSHLVEGLGLLARATCLDDPASAAALATEAVALGPVPGYPRATALAAAAWIAWLRDELAAAASWAKAAEAAATERRVVLLGPHLALLDAALAPDPARRRSSAAEAIRGFEAVGNAVWLARARLAAAIVTEPDNTPAVIRADEALRTIGDAERIVGLGGSLIISRWRRARGIGVELLGTFRVTVDGRPVGPTAWKSRKAQELLKLLALSPGPIPREALADTLWPDGDRDAVLNRLSVALATLRAGLDPERVHPADHAVASDGRSLWLDRRHVATDLDRFLALAAAAREPGLITDPPRRRAALRVADSVAGGELLPDDRDADWSIPARDQARSLALDIERTLAELALDAGDTVEAIRYWLRILERDPDDEPGHRGLIRALRQEGRHGEAQRAYARYVAQMRELDLEAASFADVAGTSATLGRR